MQYRTLGRTGLQVSEISLGTVQLGLPYGIPDQEGHLPSLTEAEAMTILHQAFEESVNFLDTARGYGDSEALIGKALKKTSREIYVATKLEPLSELMDDDEMAKAIRQSIEASRRTLDQETITILQVHNATTNLLKREVILDVLSTARHREWIRFQGVSTYGLEAPKKAIEQGYWDTVQVEFNLFNQQLQEIFDLAQSRNVGLIIRSAMLKGAIATPEKDTPEFLKTLYQTAQTLPFFFQRKNLSIPQIALLYVLSHPAVSTTLTGVVHVDQLLENLQASGQGPFTADQLAAAKTFHRDEPQLTDPRQWQF